MYIAIGNLIQPQKVQVEPHLSSIKLQFPSPSAMQALHEALNDKSSIISLAHAPALLERRACSGD
jgi:hypothetical protein